jgi:sugar phosphate permease
MTAICVSGIISGPLSGWILNNMSGFLDYKGWQWLFLLEGFPSVVAGVFAYVYLTDRPEQATWLSDDEKALLLGELSRDAQTKAARAHGSIWVALKEPKFYFLTFAYFSVPWASIVVHIWAPSVIQKSGVSNYWHIGLLSAIPYVVGAIAMYLLGRNSDRMLERRWHFMASALMAALGVALLPAAANHAGILVALLCVATAGYLEEKRSVIRVTQFLIAFMSQMPLNDILIVFELLTDQGPSGGTEAVPGHLFTGIP